MANEYCSLIDVKDVLHALHPDGKIKIALGSSVVTHEYSLNDNEVYRWIDRAMMKLHSWIRELLNPALALPITPLSKVPDELKLACPFLTAVMIRTKLLGGHRMQDEIDTAVAEWKAMVKQLLTDLIKNIKSGAYSGLKDGSDNVIFIYSGLPQWHARLGNFTIKTGIEDIGVGRIEDGDNTVVLPAESDIWDEVFEVEL